MVKQFCMTTGLIALFTVCGFSQINRSDSPDIDDPAVKATNAINVNPLGLVFGGLNASYEHLFGGRHGLMLQGGFIFKGGYNVALHYRFHYFSKQKHNGLNSPFWGPFVYFEESSTEARVEENGVRTDYDIDITYLKAGLNVGRRWVWGAFTLVFRIGYGFPIIADFRWTPEENELTETVETLTKIIGGIDGELSIGFAF